jgi:hypothetical protein
MRRALSTLLVLFFGLGPLAVTLSASDESRLPYCCRRHGDHHCVMSARAAALILQSASGNTDVPAFTAPATCPYFPGYTVAPTTTVLALAPAPNGLPGLLAQPHSPAAARAVARLSRIRTRAGRGPPASALA